MWTAVWTMFAVVAAVSCDVLPDPEALVKDEPKLSKFVSCLQEKGPCEPWTEEVIRYIPSALKEKCKGCPPEQKHFFKVIGAHFKEHRPDVYKTLRQHFDKDGVYEKKFLEFVYATD